MFSKGSKLRHFTTIRLAERSKNLPLMQVTPEQLRCAQMAALLLPFRGIDVPLKKGKREPLATWVLLRSLKCSKADAATVQVIHERLPELHGIFRSIRGKAKRNTFLSFCLLRMSLSICVARFAAFSAEDLQEEKVMTLLC